MEEHYLKAQEIVNNVEQKIKSFQNSGLNISKSAEILSEMQEAFKANKKRVEIHKFTQPNGTWIQFKDKIEPN